jgi:AbrB family looped-hinge helix DNA binding protein
MTLMVSAKISVKNQIVLPRAARSALRLKQGDYVDIEVEDGFVILKAQPQSYSRQLLGMGAHLAKNFPPGFDPVMARREKDRAEWAKYENHRRELLGLPKNLRKRRSSRSTR